MRKAADSVTTHAPAPRCRPAKASWSAIGLAGAMLATPAAAQDRWMFTAYLTSSVAGVGSVQYAACGNTGIGQGACAGSGAELYRVSLSFQPTQWEEDGREILFACVDGYIWISIPVCNGRAFFDGEFVKTPPPGTPKMSDEDKAELAHASQQFKHVAAGMGVAASITNALGNKVGALSMVGVGALSYYLSDQLNKMSLDPIDNNYTTLATVINPPLPTGIAGKPCMVSGGASVNGPATFISRSIGLAQAASTSFNRMQGAIAAGDSYWTAQQGQAMLSYTQQLRSKLDKVPLSTLFACAERAATDPASVLAFERNLSTNGLPADLAAPFAELGLDIVPATGTLYIAAPDLVANVHNAILGSISSRPLYWQAFESGLP
jgi:hypothetical protein